MEAQLPALFGSGWMLSTKRFTLYPNWMTDLPGSCFKFANSLKGTVRVALTAKTAFNSATIVV